MLYYCCPLYSSVLRIPAGHIRQTAVVPFSLLRLHGHLRRIYDRQPAEHLHRAPYPARLRLRHGDGVGQYDRDRHPALFPARRGDRLLRAGKQYGYEFRADDRAVHAHQLLLRNDFRLLAPLLFSRIHHGLFSKDAAEAADKEGTDLAGPFLFGERDLGWHLLTAALHTYGMTTTYVAMYADEIGISVNSGLYFTFMAIGLAVSRMFSGRQVDKGRITLVISLGMYLAAASFFGLAALERLMQWNSAFTSYLYIGIALSQGVAFGTMFPAFNTLFVNLAPNSQRGQRLPPISPVGMWGSGSADDRRKHRTGFRGIQLRLPVRGVPDNFFDNCSFY